MRFTDVDFLIIHPYRQHSIKTAVQLQKNKFSFKYITSNYCFPNKFSFKVLPNKFKSKIMKKRDSELNDSNVFVTCTFIYYLSRLFNFFNMKTMFKLFEKIHLKMFSKKVAKIIVKSNIKRIYTFDRCSYYLFSKLEKKKYKCEKILDVTILAIDSLVSNMNIVVNSDLKKEQLKINSKEYTAKNIRQYNEEYKKADIILAGSLMVKNSLVKSGVEESKIYVINYGSNMSPSALHSLHSQFEKSVLFVGLIDYRKGTDIIYEIAKNMPEVNFDLVGNYDKRSMLYKKLSSLKNINLIGFIDDKEKLKQIYEHNSLFLIPSRAEGLALVILEALSNGLVPICSKFTGAEDLLGNDGIFIDSFNYESYLSCIQTLLSDEALYNNVKSRILNHIGDISWENYGEKLVKLLNEV